MSRNSLPQNQTNRAKPENLVSMLSAIGNDPRRLTRTIYGLDIDDPTILAAVAPFRQHLIDPIAREDLRQRLEHAGIETPAVDPLADYAMTELGAVIETTGIPDRTPAPAAETNTDNVSIRFDQPAEKTVDIVNNIQTGAVRCDVETLRITIALGDGWSSLYRFILIAQEDIRRRNKAEGKGYTYFTEESHLNTAKSLGVSYSRPARHALLKSGLERGIWTHDPDTGRYYPVGKAKIAAIITRAAFERDLHQIVLKDKPGGKDWYIKLGGTLKQFHARAYATWIAANHDPTISRETLQTLWQATRQTLRKWEREAGVTITPNYAQTVDATDTRIPEHAVFTHFQSSADTTRIGLLWQRVNTYHAPKGIRQHNHTGQGRKVRHMVNEVCDVAKPPENVAGAHSLDVRNFDNPDVLKAWKAYQKAIRTRPIDEQPMDYLRLGQPERRRRRVCVWELMRGDRAPMTSCGDYVPMPRYQRPHYHEI